MVIDEQFDADEILRDVVDEYIDDESDEATEEEIRELNFGTVHDENANFNEMASELDLEEVLWE